MNGYARLRLIQGANRSAQADRDERINPDLMLSTPVDDIGQSEEPAELCTRDGSPCWVEGDEARWRCGTVQCGLETEKGS